MPECLVSRRTRLFVHSLLIALGVSSGPLIAQDRGGRSTPDREPSAGCGNFLYRYVRERFGPVDYRFATDGEINLVEAAHFTPIVQALKSGQVSSIGGDIAYTLNAFPNHPRALRAAAEYERRKGPEAVREMGMAALCWFDRAISFRSSDPTVRIVVATELIKRGQKNEARSHVAVAEENAGEDVSMLYNLGLLHFELGNYERAMAFAKRAYGLGMDLPGLRQKLTKAGKWQD